MNFIKAFITFLHMYKDGFFCSENAHTDPDGTRWGFYRFNHKYQSALFDIDFSFNWFTPGYAHIHGDDYRIAIDPYGKLSDVKKKKTFVK
jgi:hypothetical protein